MTCYQCNNKGHFVLRKRAPNGGVAWILYRCRACKFAYTSMFDGKKFGHPTWMVPEVTKS